MLNLLLGRWKSFWLLNKIRLNILNNMKPLILNKNKKLLLFLDIDGTLIMENQKPNYYHLPQLIRKISKFYLCGLNSNRSFHDIKNIYKYFGLNGPIILENGVYFKKNLSSKKFLLIKNPVKVKRIVKSAIKVLLIVIK